MFKNRLHVIHEELGDEYLDKICIAIENLQIKKC
jgi:hypothetical protein